MTLRHVGDHGEPCDRHPATTLEGVYQLAAIGSRMASFNHDVASKIQGVMMALDELAELAGDPDAARATATAKQALAELNQLLTANRALTRPPARTRVALRELVHAGAARAGVKLRGTLPDGEVEVAVPLVTQAIALAIDIAAGPGRSRALDVTAAGAELAFALADGAAAQAGELLALATWILARDGAALHCTAGGTLVIRFAA